jgi:hypothetical protein
MNGGGEMGKLFRTKDWQLTCLGNPGDWSPALKAIISIILASPLPMHISWSVDFIQLYNDSYKLILGAKKHPHALGNSMIDSYSEVWEQIGPLFQRVMDGQSICLMQYELIISKKGHPETHFWDYSYSPLINEEGRIVGVLTSVKKRRKKETLDWKSRAAWQ